MSVVCSVGDCGRPSRTRGWCASHYARWRKHGDVMADKPLRKWTSGDISGRIAECVIHNGDCLVWTGAKNELGYGLICVDGVMVRVHRAAWEAAHGHIPDGMVIDHMCHNRACCNVEHLRVCTLQENSWNKPSASPNSNTGYRGLYQMPNGRYAATVRKNGTTSSRRFGDIEPALQWLESERSFQFGEFA